LRLFAAGLTATSAKKKSKPTNLVNQFELFKKAKPYLVAGLAL
jgi:hypothetical protein